MKKTKIDFYKEYVYTEVLPNGLEVIILPNNNVEDVFVTFTTRYGGANRPFKVGDEFIKVPNGIAHFLEHKMFEQKTGLDPFAFFNKTGSYTNAFTNYYNTSYVYAGNKDFKENINYLLDFVQSPYFTDKNVEKEKGIICEEIKMYEDMPDNIIFERVMYNLFKYHPLKYPISGTIKDVNKITKEDLYNCYNTFYNPKNMFLVITGNVNPKDAIKIIKINQSKKKFNDVDIKLQTIEEPDQVEKEYEIIKKDIKVPSVVYAIKFPIEKMKDIEPKKRNMYLSMIFNILFDETSLFYEKMKEEELLNTFVDIDSIDTRTHKVFMLFFKSKKYKKVIEEIDKVLKHIDITDSDLERKKKVNISNTLYMFDDISNINKLLLNNKIIYNNIYTDLYNDIKSMNMKEFKTIIDNLNLNNKSILVIEKDKTN